MGIEHLERKLEDERQKLQKEEEEEEERIREKMEEEHYEAIATRKREEEEADRAAERDFGPRGWPTREEFQRAMRSAQYDRSHFHFAIVGKAGCGKSSPINAFRNLRSKDHGATQAGTRETTLRIGRYPDPGTNPPREWIVWFDVPGARTQLISDEDYFLKQGLYVFDLITLAIGDRFEKVDGQILEHCARFKVPTFLSDRRRTCTS